MPSREQSAEAHPTRSRRQTPVPVHKPRGRPFQSGNPGRPPGSKNKVTRALEQLAEGQADPPPKGRPINVRIPPINGPQDALSSIAAIFNAIREGQLTPDEIGALSLVVGRFIQIIEQQDHERRIAALEQARGKRDAKDSPPDA